MVRVHHHRQIYIKQILILIKIMTSFSDCVNLLMIHHPCILDQILKKLRELKVIIIFFTCLFLDYYQPFLEQRRKERLEVNNPFRITYNNGDFNSLLDVMKQHCDINVHFLAPNLFLESFGIYPLFAFFMLISLVYPDSMVKNIEKRIATIKTSNPPPQFPLGYSMPPVEVTSETVEIIDKFTGTRVFESPIITVFNELLKLDMIMNPPPDLSVPMISQLLNSILYNGDSSSIQGSSDGKTYHIITETKLKFDLVSNKIIEWTYTIVAVSTS